MADVRLTAEQTQAVEETGRNLQIIACAGSGKTEVIARRIAHILEEKPELPASAIVAFTFTNKAADSLRERIIRTAAPSRKNEISQMYIGTIHGYCHYLLKNYAPGFANIKVLDTVKQHHFIRRYHKSCGMDALGLSFCSIHVDVFVQCVEKMIDNYDSRDTWPKEQQDALEQYISCLRQHGYVDFPLLVFEALRQISESRTCAEAVTRVRYLVVDEYQDVDDMQEKLIGCFAAAGTNLCVVGDDDQTIYQFRGGNADNMITFANRYPNVRQIRLETNFRCAQGVVDIADTVIHNNLHRLPKKMKAAPSNPAGPTIQAMRFPSPAEQFSGLAQEIKKVHDSGVPWSQIAVLTRKGKTAARVTWALESAGIPVCGDSAERLFEEVHFKRLQNTLRNMATLDRVTLYSCWEDLVDQERFVAAFKGLRSATRGGAHRLSSIVCDFCANLDFLDEATEDFAIRKTCVDGICTMLDDFDEIYGDWQLSARIDGFLKFLETRAAEEYKYHNFAPVNETDDAVQVMTVHKAKGLEFQCVFLPNLMEKEFPVGNYGGKKYWHVLGGTFAADRNRYQGGVEDERKLFYVAVTRAKEMLYLTYELSKHPVSPFVAEAAKSNYLQIDTADLLYDPNPRGGTSVREEDMLWETEEREETDWEVERQARQAYWAAVKQAKAKLYDFYGTAAHFNPGAFGDLSSIRSMSPEQILQKAKENGLI